MSESKFRAWDTEAKCYIEDPILVDNFGQVYVVCEEPSDKRGTCLITHKPNVILEQYTGEVDDNDKEIAEGDIVQYVGADEETVIRATVKYGNPDDYTNEDGTLYIRGFYYGGCEIDDSVNLLDEEYEDLCTRVIGNIHENPELLETKNEI